MLRVWNQLRNGGKANFPFETATDGAVCGGIFTGTGPDRGLGGEVQGRDFICTCSRTTCPSAPSLPRQPPPPGEWAEIVPTARDELDRASTVQLPVQIHILHARGDYPSAGNFGAVCEESWISRAS